MVTTNGATPRGAVQSLGKPTATFPGGVAADAQLAIAVNREQTTLAVPMGASDTSMTVQNIGGILIWSLLSIDNEIVQVNNSPAGNVVPIGRGFDGTTPAQHLAGATVAGLIDAYHHNTLVAEVEAIETALGANLANVGGAQAVVNTAYIFPAQTPGGTLATGAQVVTLAPVPKGVNGTDTNHYLYISGGIGTAEAVKIIGGTAVSGGASGTVIVQCGFTHSGAWTIQTATAGIQEAYQTLVTAGTGGTIYIALQTNLIYSSVLISAVNITIAGLASGASIIQAANNANIGPNPLITTANTGTGFRLFNVVVDGNKANTGITPTLSVAACVMLGAGDCQIVNCEIRNAPLYGIFIGDASISPENIVIDRCHIHHNGRIDGNGGSGSGYGGVGIMTGGNARVNNLRITNNKFIHNHNAVVQPGDGCGVNLNATSVVVASNYFQDNFNAGGGQIVVAALNAASTAAIDAGYSITGNNVVATTTFGTPVDATDGIECACRDFSITGNVISGVSRYGICVNGPNTGNGSVSGNTIFNLKWGFGCGVFAGDTVDHVVFNGNSVNVTQYGFNSDVHASYIAVKNNVLVAGTQSLSGTFTAGCELANNLVGVRPYAPHSVTVTASPMTYTAGVTQEMILIQGYTTLTVTYLGSGLQIANNAVANSNWTWLLMPNDLIHITYTGTPTMTTVPLD